VAEGKQEEEAMAVEGGAVVGVGSVVQVVGLQSRTELNNATGRVLMLVVATGRWRVELDLSPFLRPHQGGFIDI
jgi:hypothetical protein